MAPLNRTAVAALAGLGGLSACDTLPDIDDRIDENVIITAHDESADFSGFRTFALTRVASATIDALGNVQTEVLDSGVADALVGRVSALMSERGYQEVSREQAPELGLGIGVIEETRTGTGTNDFWNSYYSTFWGYPGYGFYYPFAFSYAYRTGALAITLVDLRSVRTDLPDASLSVRDGGLPAVWTSVAYRVFLEGTPPEPQQIEATIEQAFRQSPYLHR